MTQQTIKSPCIGVCTVADNGLCMGCFRTVNEITQWLALSDEQRDRIVDQLAARMEAMFV